MNSAAIRSGIRAFTKSMSKHAPAIGAGIGIVSIFATAFLAVRSTPEAHRVTIEGKKAMEEAKELYSNEPSRSASECREIRKTMAKQYAKLYWPAVASAILGTTAIIFSHRVSTKRNLALASAYAMTLNEYREFRRKARDANIISQEREHEIRDSIYKDRLIENKDRPMFGNPGPGKEAFYDTWSGQKFWSSVNEVDKAVNDFNFGLITQMEKPINDLYYLMGIPEVDCGNFDISSDHGPIAVVYGSIFIEDEGRSYTTITIDDIERRIRIR